ncbi:MAG TPA: metallopeptidase TldD-related protein [Bryobacteraceae bacterium]|nr:metallopeptidase TldD-related protein [Bryobacteraceae bacterium]
MKALLFAAAMLAAGLVISAQAPPADPIIRAMHDELDRSLKLTVPNLEKPYFIEYLLDDNDSFNVSATLGGLTRRRRERFRNLEVRVRVGDYKFDNTNYSGSDINFGTRYDLERFPLDDSYPVLRRYFWLETDTEYKSAVEAIARKRAALRNLNVNEQLSDFAHVEPVHLLRDFQKLNIDEDGWSNRVRKLSAIFDQYPEVEASNVEFRSGDGGYYLLNSEGTEVRVPDRTTSLRVRAEARAPDGMRVRDAVSIQTAEATGMPGEAELTRSVQTLAQRVTALTHADKGEDYSGPVLFEGTAGAQIFAEVLGRNLALTRRPVIDSRRNLAVPASELDGRLGARILPDTFDVWDDPLLKEWRGKPLFGSFEVDREGVLPKKLHLIENGTLKGYLLTRQPVRGGGDGSNGHARMPGQYGASTAGVSNLFVTASTTVPLLELRRRLQELVSMRGKPYGIVVREMDFPSSMSVEDARRILAGVSAGGALPVSMPIQIYRVYPDGREVLMRGMQFRGFSARSLKDILAAGDDLNRFDFLDSAVPFALMGAASYESNATVVAPSILIDDLELHPVEEEQPRLPVVPAPELVK